MNTLTPEKVTIYNAYMEWLSDDLNFEDTSVGMYYTAALTPEIITELKDSFSPEIKFIYWDKDTLIFKDCGYYVTIKQINIVDESKWIIAEIK